MRSSARFLDGALVLLAVLSGAGSARAEGAERIAVSGLVDAELWNTGSGSHLLERNDGEPASLGRLRLWAGADLARGLEGFALGRIEGGDASHEGETTVELEQAFLRYDAAGPARLLLEAGKIIVPFGNFGRRYLSTVNPLVGAPGNYEVSYPWGAVVGGRVARLDFRLALLDRPPSEVYVPDVDTAWRPAVTVGVTPLVGFRVAGYWTQGPYLGSEVQPMLPAGDGWRDYDQEVTGIELSFSRGYFELNGDLAFSGYELPTTAGPSRGRSWFVEPKYTWTPRLFTALRLGYNDYPYILPINPYYWIEQNVAYYDVEIGGGWRFTPDLLLKASYRADRFEVADPESYPDGDSFSLQVSYEFDVNSWFSRLE